MHSNIAKSPHGYLVEFHCHTINSYDGLTSEEELLRTCIARGIGLLTVTEHDRIPELNIRRFQEAGVHIISGCEFTCERGSHIIGLFIQRALDKGRPAGEIFQHILNQGGLVMIPHPFKPGSGFCTLYADYEGFMNKVSLMEAYNGGMLHEHQNLPIIQSLSSNFNIKLVAASDAHKANHVGYYVTAYPEIVNDDVRATLVETQGTLFVDSTYARKPRSLKPIQQSPFYQQIVACIPYAIRRFIKICAYRWRNKSYEPSIPRYVALQ